MGINIIKAKYLVVGSSHAGLSAVDEIRTHDKKGFLTMVTKEDILPYSPTIKHEPASNVKVLALNKTQSNLEKEIGKSI